MTGLSFGWQSVEHPGDAGQHRRAMPGKDGISVNKRMVGSVAVLTLAGELDAHSAPATQVMLSRAMPGQTPVLLDLSEIRYISSAGLRTLLLAYRRAQRFGTPIALVGVSETLRGVLSATGFLRFFQVAESIPDGVAALDDG
jgi:anti-sigma B factor antagonist